MKYLKYVQIFVSFLWNNQVVAQLPKPLYYQIRFSPLALLDPQSPVIQVGAQAFYAERIAASLELGIPYHGLYNAMYRTSGPFGDRYKYGKLRSELKYLYPLKSNWLGIKSRNYFGLEAFVVPIRYRQVNEYLYLNNVPYRYDHADIKKNIVGLCIKYGNEISIGKHLILDNFFGFGVRRVGIKHVAVNLTEEEPYEPIDSDFGFGKERREGIFYKPHLAYGFKVGYIINPVTEK